MNFLSLLITYLLVSLSARGVRGQEISSEPAMGFQTEVEGAETVRSNCRYARLGLSKIPNCPTIGNCSPSRMQMRPISTCLKNWRICNGVFFSRSTGTKRGCAVTRCANPRERGLKTVRNFLYLSCTHTAAQPKPKPEPKKPAASRSNYNRCYQLASEILRLTNQHRAYYGIRPLCMNAKLRRAADVHSLGQSICDRMSHYGCSRYNPPDRYQIVERINDSGYRWGWWGENVAWGYTTASAVFNAWKYSAPHNANMLNRNFNHVGIAVRSRDGNCQSRPYYTQVFGQSNNERCEGQLIAARLSAAETDLAKEQNVNA